MARIFDITLSLFALLVLTPLFLLLVLMLRFSGEGKVFFIQQRVGRGGALFGLIKFATMLENSPNFGTGTITIKNDPRILPMGSFLRSSKLNELPQLLNVLIGDMSLVGPRPLTQENFNNYSMEARKQIFSVLPGLSGIGSIIFRNEERILGDKSSALDFYIDFIAPYKETVETWYVANNSLKIYWLLIFITILTIAFPGVGLHWLIFKNLPAPPDELKVILGWPKPN